MTGKHALVDEAANAVADGALLFRQSALSMSKKSSMGPGRGDADRES